MTTLNAPPPSPTLLPREYSDLTGRLDAVGARFRLAGVLRGLGRFALVVVPVVVGALFVAGYWVLPSAGNVGLLAGMGVAVVFGYAAFLHRALWVRPSYAEIARLVEQHGARPAAGLALDNALINAVLLAHDLEAAAGEGKALMGSNAWIPQVLKEASAATGQVPLEKAVPWRQPRNAWLAAGLVGLVCAVGIGLSPGTFRHGFSVLVSPMRFVPHQGSVKILSVVPGNDTALAGQPLLFSVSVEVPEHRSIAARLTVYPASGKSVTYPMAAFGAENNQYVRQGLMATEDIDYVITAGDTETERFHITVLPQIHLTSWKMEAVAPAYTGRAKQTLALAGKEATAAKGTLDVAAGSTVTMRVGLDGPAKEVLMDVAGGSPVAMAAEGAGFAVAMSVR